MDYREAFKVQSRDRAVRFHDVTDRVKEIAAPSPLPPDMCSNIPMNIARNTPAVAKISTAIRGVTINAPGSRGESFITSGSGGSVANASAAKVSMIIFTHSICIAVSGISTPRPGPITAVDTAATLIVNWKTIKR